MTDGPALAVTPSAFQAAWIEDGCGAVHGGGNTVVVGHVRRLGRKERSPRMFLASELESIALPDETTQCDDTSAQSRCPRRVFEDLCLLGNGEHSQFLQL